MKVVGKFTGEINVKRFYLPGISLEGRCPQCGAPFNMSMTDYDLSYPVAGEDTLVICYCCECKHTWKVPLRLEVSVSIPTG